MTPVEVLTKAKDVLKERGWTQGRYVEDMCTGEGPVCLFGAINTVVMGDPRIDVSNEETRELRLLVQAVNYETSEYLEYGAEVADWNDDPERTVFDVERVLDRAIVLAAALPSD
jgi:hypothetical protein